MKKNGHRFNFEIYEYAKFLLYTVFEIVLFLKIAKKRATDWVKINENQYEKTEILDLFQNRSGVYFKYKFKMFYHCNAFSIKKHNHYCTNSI